MKYSSILHSFTNIEPLDGFNEITTYFIHLNDSKYQFELKPSSVNLNDCNINEFDEFIDSIYIQEMESSSHSHLVHEILMCGKQIAAETRRSTANHYSVLDDGILIWYKGVSAFDTPVQYCRNTVVYNDNAHRYFRRLKFDVSKFDAEIFDVNLQKTRDYKRIII